MATQALIAVAIKLKGTARAAVRSHVAEHSTLSHATRASGDDWAARDGGSGGGSSCTRAGRIVRAGRGGVSHHGGGFRLLLKQRCTFMV